MKRVFALLLLTTIIISCGSKTETPESTENVTDISGKYTILELTGSKLNSEDIGKVMSTMVFEKEGMKYSTNIGCNQINGSYTLNGNSIKILPGMSTLMACPNDLESSYLVALEQVDNYKIENFMLKVYQGDSLKIVFQPFQR